MNRKFWIFLGTTLFSQLGDTIAVVAIPLLLLREHGSLAFASSFSILVLLSCLLTARPSAMALKKLNPMELICVCDSVAALLLVILAHQEALLRTAPSIFLLICFVIALVINFPMFSKYQLLYQYFIQKEELSRLTALQGKLFGLVFVCASIIVSICFERLGFKALIMFDAATYLPLLGMCWFLRRGVTLGYSSIPIVLEQGTSGVAPERKRAVRSYYVFNAFSYFFSNFRAHLLLTVLAAIYSERPLYQIGLAMAAGTAVSLAIYNEVDRTLMVNEQRAVGMVAGCVLFVGLLLSLRHSILSLSLIGLLMTEISAAIMTLQRRLQVSVSEFYSSSRLAEIGSVTGLIASAGMTYLMIKGMEAFGPIVSFGTISVGFLGIWVIVRPRAAGSPAAR